MLTFVCKAGAKLPKEVQNQRLSTKLLNEQPITNTSSEKPLNSTNLAKPVNFLSVFTRDNSTWSLGSIIIFSLISREKATITTKVQ